MAAVQTGTWKFSLLPSPPRRKRAKALGFWGAEPIGYAEDRGRVVSFAWIAGNPVEVAPAGFNGVSLGRRASPEHAVGSYYVRGKQHAMLVRRRDNVFEAIDLHPKAYERTLAMGASGEYQVGYGTPKGARRNVALLWSGSAESVIELHATDPELETTAYGVAGGVQVGYSGGPARHRAMLWRGSTASVIELHPKEAKLSECESTDGIEQVGVASVNVLNNIPSLWRGSAESWVDLSAQGFHGGAAYGCSNGLQVGCVALDKDNQRHHAALWSGSASSFIDLHDFVPKQDFNDSCAWALLTEGGRLRIVGEVSLFKDGAIYSQRAALWEAQVSA